MQHLRQFLSEACHSAAQGHDWPDREGFSALGRCRARLTQSGEHLFPLTFVSAVGSEKSRAALMHQMFRNMEDVYHQHLKGHLDPHLWRGLEVIMRDLNTAPGVQAWWRSYSGWFGGEEFAKFINQQQQTATRTMISSQHVYEVRPRKRSSQRPDLISDALPFRRYTFSFLPRGNV